MMELAATKLTTRNKAIATLAESPYLYLPLGAYLGHAAQPVVQAGDRVLKYQLVAKECSPFSANVHSPVSGSVIGVQQQAGIHGAPMPMLVVRNDFEGASLALSQARTDDPAPETIAHILAQAGVVGAGGAQFPTALKYRSAQRPLNAFIINGTECEPYLTADYAVMHEHPAAIIEGIRLLNLLLQARDIAIVIEEHNCDLQQVFAPYLSQPRYAGIRIQRVAGAYPQGSELQVVHAVSGREIAPPHRPYTEGFVVSNVSTILAAYRALVNHQPVTRRTLTVAGDGLPMAGNYDVPIGTPIGFLLSQLGITPSQHTVVMGGPMMGKAVSDWVTPVTKGCGGILALPRALVERENCIHCGKCIEACPMRLMPLQFAEGWRRNKPAMLHRHQLALCFECGACEYACPANVPLMDSIKAGKALLREMMPQECKS